MTSLVERRWRAAKLVGINELECDVLDMSYRDAYALAIKEHSFREEHNEVEKARGVIRTYYHHLKDVEGFEQFMDGRTKEEAVVSLIRHLDNVKSRDDECKLKSKLTLQSDPFSFPEMKRAETATGKNPYWIRDVGRNILKITPPLEKEVAVGSVSVEAASEIARIDEPEIQERFVEHAKSEGLSQSKAKRLVSSIKSAPKQVKEGLAEGRLTVKQAVSDLTMEKLLEHVRVKKTEPIPIDEYVSGLFYQSGGYGRQR